MSRDDDPDETGGRGLYRARASGLARSQLSIGKRSVKLSKHKLSEVIEFGERLVVTEDLDPVYVALCCATLPKKQLKRLLLAYFCFYHLGAAAALSEFEGEHYWELMENAALNEIPPNMNGDWPGDRWPRGSERRHFRGKKCVDAVRALALSNLWGSGVLARDKPEGLIETLVDGYGPEELQLSSVMGRVQSWPMFGPWIAFKVADILERVLAVPIKFPNDLTLFYSEPRKALDMLTVPAEQANLQLLQHFYEFRAPPRYERRCSIQEVETICCKWKSSVGGHYWVGKDIHELRHGLVGWGKTATRLLRCMPVEVARTGSLFT